ncbi:hypothetical protein D3C75_523580 [compost metagenome]
MPQNIQLEQVFLKGVVIEVGGLPVGAGVIRRVLHRRHILHINIIGYNHDAAGMLAGAPFDAGAASRQPVDFRQPPGIALLLLKLLNEAEGGFFGNGADGAGAEYILLAEQHLGIVMGHRLVIAGEVQVNIGNLVTFKAQEGFEGNILSFTLERSAAIGAILVGQVEA